MLDFGLGNLHKTVVMTNKIFCYFYCYYYDYFFYYYYYKYYLQ